MKKEILVEKIDIFLNQAIQANCYYLIIKQFSKNSIDYYEQINLSSAFYSYTYNALVTATFMELAKMYDTHTESLNIEKLIKICKENKKIFYNSSTEKKKLLMKNLPALNRNY
ncbi:hypothetical protein OKW23_001412 [Bacilli bacterium PM5-9]|nr:hypothetical protein [Bacilli bacterium PM5-9]